jgi:aspartate/methionine/tyrosine aminotransferase
MSNNPFAQALRNQSIAPFHVMEIMKASALRQAAGHDVIHMSIGEPDFTAPEPVQAALAKAVAKGQTAYTEALGIRPLREAISQFYAERFALTVPVERIVITAGASGAMLLALACLADEGREVLMPDPCYPCNRHFVASVGAKAGLISCDATTAFHPTAEQIDQRWTTNTQGVMLASPSNPTGTSIAPTELAAIHQIVRKHRGFLLVDEIYQCLSYGQAPQTALALGDDVVVINSFSKYFNMTGWRLGWMVVPPWMVSNIEKLAQNLFICASSLAQHAALACFESDTLAIYEARRQEFARRRDFLVPALRDLGIGVPAEPDGAFYIYADVSSKTDDSERWAYEVLERANVCLVPGKDFGFAAPHRHVRLSYATALPRLQQAIERLATIA